MSAPDADGPPLLRAVLDTNVYVSGTILSRGTPFEVLEAQRRQVYVLKPRKFLAPQTRALFAVTPLALFLKRTILSLSAQPSKNASRLAWPEALARVGEMPRQCGL